MHRTVTTVDGLSINFADYDEASRAELDGTHTRVEIHVPNEFAAHLRLGRSIVIEADEAVA